MTIWSRSVVDASRHFTIRIRLILRGGLPQADHDARHPDLGILAAFAHRLNPIAIAGGQP
jgi:hypothetical protein